MLLDDMRYPIDKKRWERYHGPPPDHPCSDPALKDSEKCLRTVRLFKSAVNYGAREQADPSEKPTCLPSEEKRALRSKTEKDTLKVLHCGTGTSSQVPLRNQQRKDGHIADVFVHTGTNKKQGFDINLSMSPYEFSWKHNILSGMRNVVNGNFRDLLNYEVYHLYHDAFLLPNRRDIWWLKKYLGKKVLLDWRGQGVRVWGFHTLPWFKDIKQTCATPDLLDYQQYEGQFEWVPIGIEVNKIRESVKSEFHEIPTIIHSPSNRNTKGTVHVLKAIKQLRKDKYKFDFILNEKQPHDVTLRNFGKSDICVGWMDPDFGIYAKIEMENMALGNTVCATIREDFLKDQFKGCPIVNVTPDSLVKNLRWLIEDYDFRKKNVKKNIDYVTRMHDIVPVSRKFYKVYKEC